MDIVELRERQNIPENTKLSKAYLQFGALMDELRKKELPLKIREAVNRDIDELNSVEAPDHALLKRVKQKQAGIIKLLEKELKTVPKHYYRKLWLAVGMSAFGLPIGVAFGLSLGNMGLLAIGLPIGMAIGAAVGSGMDKKAQESGRQLDIELKD